jgi:hypothetical protein
VSGPAGLPALEEVIGSSGVAARIEALLPAGVRPRQLSVRTLLAGMCLTLAGGRPAHLTRVRQALVALPGDDQRRLGILSLSNFLCKLGQSLSFCYITVGSFRRPGQTGTRSGNVTANAFMAAFQPIVPVPRCPLWRTSPSPSMWRPVTFLIPR